MRVAVIQYRPPKGAPEEARAALVDAADQAGRDGARIIVCPEMATTGYIWADGEALMPHAEPADGPTSVLLGEVAARHGAWIFCGFAEREGEKLFNSMLMLGPSGSACQPYRKIFLFPADEAWADPGRERMVVETEHGLVVPGICMDLNDPVFTALLWQQGARICAFATNWLDQGEDPLSYWRMQLHPWRGYFLAANSWGEDGEIAFTGLSTILGPDGQVLARAEKTGDQILMADLV